MKASGFIHEAETLVQDTHLFAIPLETDTVSLFTPIQGDLSHILFLVLISEEVF